ncbi:TetR/AcrR family transcriptional regulator [Desulfuribacillus alkaliarsenatis]|uniref:TetR family transcriptional regulator n=1 Tax=Desulfuribacillus alkaliarsenatis TaxID=766136 RepID=A0A1E5FYN4_9FIRM|nr:TetR/AcrR family transcriptional regulator [Desulfuribacillus alkaliarsenatis]OEF95685.1 TetR family transcriptional regulator [Desulfuribacillus alkaliarsenatis]
MPPKTKFAQEEIVEAAFEIAKEEGIESITIRKVASKLGSSIAPIYVNFKTIEELKEAVIQRIFKLSEELLKVRYTDQPFLNVGIASLRFAKDYPMLFRDLMLSNNKYLQNHQPDLSGVFQEMGQDPELEGFTQEQMLEVLFKMRVFTLGLSVMEANGLLPKEFDDQAVIDFLASMGSDVVAAARLKSQNND